MPTTRRTLKKNGTQTVYNLEFCSRLYVPVELFSISSERSRWRQLVKYKVTMKTDLALDSHSLNVELKQPVNYKLCLTPAGARYLTFVTTAIFQGVGRNVIL